MTNKDIVHIEMIHNILINHGIYILKSNICLGVIGLNLYRVNYEIGYSRRFFAIYNIKYNRLTLNKCSFLIKELYDLQKKITSKFKS